MTSMTTTTHEHPSASRKSSQDDSLRGHASAIKEDLHSLKEDTAAAASAVGQTIQGEAERVTDLAKSGGERAAEMHSAVCGTVRRHPTAAVLISVGIGAVVGRLLAGR